MKPCKTPFFEAIKYNKNDVPTVSGVKKDNYVINGKDPNAFAGMTDVD